MNRVLFCSCMFLFVILCSCTSKTVDKEAQAKNDSIKKYLELAGNDTITYVKRTHYNDKAYSLIDLNKNDTNSISSLYKSTMNFYRFNKLEKLNFASSLLLKKALLSKNKYWVALSYKTLGMYYMNNSENEKALSYLFKAKKVLISLNKYNDVMDVLLVIGLTQYYAGDFLGSNKTAFEILKIKKRLHNNVQENKFNSLTGNIYNQIGNNLANLKQDDKAILYYKKINKKKISLKFKIIIVNNSSLSYIELGEYQKAYNQLVSITRIKEAKKISPNSYATTLSLLGYCKLKMNSLSALPNIFFKVDEIYKKNKSVNGMNYNQVYLSMYYEKINDTNNAIRAAKRAFELSKEYNNPADILYSLKQLIIVDKENASKNAQEYIRVNDSMQIAERQFRDKFARLAFETEEITQEKDKAVHQKWIVGSIGGFIILIVILLLIITRQKSKQKELQFLQTQQKTNEEIYELMLLQKSKEDLARQNEQKRIAIELHDGVMNKLASTRLNLNLLSHKKDKETIEKCLTHVEGIYLIEQEIRNIAHNLNQEVFNGNNSFTALLNDFVANQNNITNTEYKLEIDRSIDWSKISSSIKMNLYRIIQEASHNINKFAQAKKAIISFMFDEGNLCLLITDDGKGFDTEKQTEGIGLKNIKQRVESLNGKLVIQSINNKKTSLNIAIPFG